MSTKPNIGRFCNSNLLLLKLIASAAPCSKFRNGTAYSPSVEGKPAPNVKRKLAGHNLAFFLIIARGRNAYANPLAILY